MAMAGRGGSPARQAGFGCAGSGPLCRFLVARARALTAALV